MIDDPTPSHEWATYEEFYRSQSDAVLTFLTYLGFPWHIAEDAAQHAMVETNKHWHKIERPDLWARKAAEHEAGRIRRKTRHEVGLPEGYEGEASDDSRLAYTIEQYSTLPLIRQLSRQLARAFALYLGGYDTKEIAEYGGISIRTAQKHLQDAREALKKALAETEYREGVK